MLSSDQELKLDLKEHLARLLHCEPDEAVIVGKVKYLIALKKLRAREHAGDLPEPKPLPLEELRLKTWHTFVKAGGGWPTELPGTGQASDVDEMEVARAWRASRKGARAAGLPDPELPPMPEGWPQRGGGW